MRREDGQATVLIVGLVGVVALLMAVVINASSVFLDRQRLGDLADGAVASAADQLDLQSLYAGGLDGFDAPLSRSTMDEAVATYVRATGDGDVRWTIEVTGTRVTVRLERTVDLPLVPPGWSGVATVGAESTAVLRLHD